MVPNVPLRMFRTDGRCFADIRASTREFGGWRRNIFMQQSMLRQRAGCAHEFQARQRLRRGRGKPVR